MKLLYYFLLFVSFFRSSSLYMHNIFHSKYIISIIDDKVYSKRKKINSHATTSCTEFKIKQLHELQHSNKWFWNDFGIESHDT